MANLKLEPDVISVLQGALFVGNSLRLTGPKLERELYTRVAAVIVKAGGKWNKKTQTHLFDSDPRASLGMALKTGVVIDQQKKYQAFFTPEPYADQIAQLADVSGQVVLEPSAGKGALVTACRKAGACSVQAIELNPSWAAILTLMADGVSVGDFLAMKPNCNRRYSRIVMNPPFNKGQMTRHIKHAVKHWLCEDGLLASIVMSGGNLTPLEEFLKPYRHTYCRMEKRAFKSTGTYVQTGILLIMGKNHRPRL